jgi:catalase
VIIQLAESTDQVDDSTVHWPADRPGARFGTIALTGHVPHSASQERRIIFDPIPRVDGIESSGDPLLEPRATVYL